MWHQLKYDSRSKQKSIGQNTVTSLYKYFFIIKNEIIYLMQKNGLTVRHMHSKIPKGLRLGFSFDFFEYLSFEFELSILRISCKFRKR